MDISININVGLDEATKGWIMAALDDKVAEFNAKVAATVARVQGDVAALKAENDSLKQQLAAAGTGQAAIDALTQGETQLDQIDPATPTVVPPSPAPAPTS